MSFCEAAKVVMQMSRATLKGSRGQGMLISDQVDSVKRTSLAIDGSNHTYHHTYYHTYN